MRRVYQSIIGLFFLLFVLGSCQSYYRYQYYFDFPQKERTQLKNLFNLYEKQQSPESRYNVVQQIVRIMEAEENTPRINMFLIELIDRFPEDPFNAYYLFLVAENYRKAEAKQLAEYYYQRLLREGEDLLVDNNSIHLQSLKQLILLVERPEDSYFYNYELIERFSYKVDLWEVYYSIAKACERLGQWSESIYWYREYQKVAVGTSQIDQATRKAVNDIIDIYQIKDKSWAYEDLDTLVNKIKVAIDRQDGYLLSYYQSKANFFAVSWIQDEFAADIGFLSNLSLFMSGRVRYRDRLDELSNNQEAFLQTSNWRYRLQDWYFYFKRIQFPADPEIHGKWEWAGIYFGEKPYRSSG